MRPQKAQSRHELAIFSLVFGIGVSAFLGFTYLATPAKAEGQANPAQGPPTGSVALGAGTYFFGNNITASSAWQMPANTLVSTSFVTTHRISGNLLMTIYTITYGLSENTELTLGLYVNGVLESDNTLNASQTHAITDSLVGQAVDTSTGQIANFTQETQGYQAALSLSASLPAGTTITLTAFSNSPIWIRTTQAASGQSYELSGASAIPRTLPGNASATAVPSLCIQGDANEA